jgi:hypothetical protein
MPDADADTSRRAIPSWLNVYLFRRRWVDNWPHIYLCDVITSSIFSSCSAEAFRDVSLTARKNLGTGTIPNKLITILSVSCQILSPGKIIG